MPEPRTYATAGAFRRALEERLKRASRIGADRSQPSPAASVVRPSAGETVSGRAAPWALKGGYALELRFKAARSTVDIDLTLQTSGRCTNRRAVTPTRSYGRCCRTRLTSPLGDWFEYTIGPPVLDLTAAPYGGARYPVEARMDERIFARFHLDAGDRRRGHAAA